MKDGKGNNLVAFSVGAVALPILVALLFPSFSHIPLPKYLIIVILIIGGFLGIEIRAWFLKFIEWDNKSKVQTKDQKKEE
jgi:hypothetical protein